MSAPLTEDLARKIQRAVLSHAEASGHFDRVGEHTPKNAPGHGITAAITLRRIVPVPSRSGMNTTTIRADWRLELYKPMEDQPGLIDPSLAAATIEVFLRLSADFTLGGLVDEIPLLGANGASGLTAEQRYVQFPNGSHYRLVEIAVPTVHDDVLTQAR